MTSHPIRRRWELKQKAEMALKYPANKDPFLEDNDDDFSFASQGRSSRSQQSKGHNYSPWEEPQDEYSRPKSQAELFQEQKQLAMNRQLDSTQRIMGSIYDSERVGIATAEELVRQGEQLDNIERKTASINADMKTTQRHLNSIKSVFGGIRNWWSGRAEEKEKPKEDAPSSRPDNPRLREAMDKADRRPDVHPAMRVRSEDVQGFYADDDLDSKFMSGASGGGQSAAAQRASLGMSSGGSGTRQSQVSSFAEYDQQFNQNIDTMSDGMARLKMLASGLGDEIQSQNDQIDDRIMPSVERADQNIRDQNRQMKRILGVKK